MKIELSDAQRQARLRFREFVQAKVSPYAPTWDREEGIPLEVIDYMQANGYLGTLLPAECGGGGMDAITYGLLTEEIGRGCSSLRSLLTVHDMVAMAIWRWGSRDLKAKVARSVGSGKTRCALALSETESGSDAASVQTVATKEGDEYVINGGKKWITFGQVADLFLVLARLEDKLTAFLVPSDAPGLSRRPMRGIVGTRASLMAELEFNGCRIPSLHIVGRSGFGLSHVFSTALDLGRYSVAWGSVGIAQACLDACLE